MVTKEELEKDYIDAGEAKSILGLSGSRMSRLCTGGRFPGAFKFGSIWIIPREAVLNHTKLKPGAKKRGRPVKASVEASAAPQKRRGRPPKAKTETAAAAAAAVKSSKASVSPKKRGRPKGSKTKTTKRTKAK